MKSERIIDATHQANTAINVPPAQHSLKRNEILSLVAKHTMQKTQTTQTIRIVCQTGMLWITANGDEHDYFLARGESQWWRAAQHLVIEAISDEAKFTAKFQ
jgi:Protein of unknown function (DUF2917)